METDILQAIPKSRRFYNVTGRVGVAILSTLALINVPDITDIPRIILLLLFNLGSNLDIFKRSFNQSVRIVKVIFGIILCIVAILLFRENPDLNSLFVALGGIVTLLSAL